MGRVTSNMGRPIQGVSQQPDKVRIDGQCTASVNLRPDVVRGLVTRVGTTSVGKIDTVQANPTDRWHYYDRGTGEEYHIRITSTGVVEAWSPDGTVHTVNVIDAGAQTYLTTADPKNDLELTTIGDTTFIINKKKAVLPDNTRLSDAKSYMSLIFVSFMDYALRVSVMMDYGGSFQEVAYYQAGDGSTSAHNNSVRTEWIASNLHSALTGGSGSGSGATWGGLGGVGITDEYNVDLDANVIAVERKDLADYAIEVTDDASGNNVYAIKNFVKSTSKLPGTAPDGFLVEIDGIGSDDGEGQNSGGDTFWLKAEQNANEDGVRWVEAIAPGLVLNMDKDTMPVQLVRETLVAGVATFELAYGAWEDRAAGDDTSNPLPSFVDTDNPLTLSTIGIFQNRLYFTSGEAVIMSRSNRFYNFFRETTQIVLDTDPVDIFADAEKVNNFSGSIAFDGDLVFFSENAQFVLLGDETVTAENASLRETTAFESYTGVKPVASGENLFFPYKYGRFVGVREYFTDSIVDTKRARPITDHVNRYVEGNPILFRSSTSLNLLLTRTDEFSDKLYTYEWLWVGAEKQQSAWGEWTFEGATIEDVQFKDTTVYLVISRPEGVFIEHMDVGDPPEEGIEYGIRLDRKQSVTMTWNATLDRWETPDLYTSETTYIGVEGSNCSQPGNEIFIEKDGSTLFTFDEISDGTNPVDVWLGIEYEAEYIPSQPVVKDGAGQAMDLDRLTIGRFVITYDKTGDITMTVRNNFGQERTKQFGNRQVGAPTNLVGYSPQVAGTHTMPVRRKSDQYELIIKTKDHRPLEIRDFQFDGTFNPRGRRI